MIALLRVLLLGTAALLLPRLHELPRDHGTVALLAGAVLLALVSSGAPRAFAAAGGALGALGFTLAPDDPLAAGGLLLLGVHAGRLLRARTLTTATVGALLSVVCGAGTAAIVARLPSYAPVVLAASAVACGILASVPTLVPVDDEIAFRLTCALPFLPPETAALVRDARALRRLREDDLALLPPAARARMESPWASLASAATARADAGSAHQAALDAKIRTLVETVTEQHSLQDAAAAIPAPPVSPSP